MDQWYVARGSSRQGPFTMAQLRTLAAHGRLRTTDLLLPAEGQSSIAAGDVSDLFPAPLAGVPDPEAARMEAPVPVAPTPPSSVAPPDTGSRFKMPVPTWMVVAAVGVVVPIGIALVYGVVGATYDSSAVSASAPAKSEVASQSEADGHEPVASSATLATVPVPEEKPSQGSLEQPAPCENYSELARILSQDYLLNGEEVIEEPSQPELKRLSTSAEQIEVQRAAARLLQGIELFEEQRLAAEQDSKDRMRRGRELLDAAGRGELTRTVTYVDTDGRERSYEVEDTWAVMWAHSLAAGGGPKDPVVEALKRRITLDSSRARAWDELLPGTAEKFAGPLAQQPLVKIEFLGDGPNGERLSESRPRFQDLLPYRNPFPGRYVARNVAGRDLHHVTLAIDLHHYSTLPDATLRHVYYVPVWEQDAVLEFSRNFVTDPTRGGKRYAVPLDPETGVAKWSGATELQMLAGIVRMQATLWSDEARQAPTAVEFPERALKVAAQLVTLAENRVASQTFGWFSKQAHQAALDQWLRPVVAIMPAQNDLAVRAQRLLNDFESVRPELLQQKDAELLAACTTGRRYVGRWSSPGLFGELGLLFITCDSAGKQIRAEVFDPRKPEERRLLAGFVALDRSTQKKTILLEPLFPQQGGASDILSPAVKSYRFRLNPGGLTGEASTNDVQSGSGPSPMPIMLNCAPGDAEELAAARKRNQTAPAGQPREPFAEPAASTERVPLNEARRRADEFGAAIRLSAMGKETEARQAFEKIIASYPDTPLAAAAQGQLDQLKERKQGKK